MPRRPLFCQTCDDLLDELEKAAEAAAACSGGVRTAGTPENAALFKNEADLRNRYFELKERALRHRELAHGQFRRSP
jgi:hypothetical protein